MVLKALESLNQQSTKAKVIVVDNGSVDDSLSLIEKNFPQVSLIKLPHNHGFAGGVNVGIKAALAEGAWAIALLNNDAIADKDWLKDLAETMDANEKTGIVCSRMMRQSSELIDSCGEDYSIWGMPFPRGRNQSDHGQYDKPGEVFAASGGASLYRAEMLKQIGLFDEAFFAYYEDVDISFRARLAGWQVMYCPDAVVRHKVNATSSKLGSFTRYHATKNFFLLYSKNMPGWLYWKYLPLFMLQAARLAASSLLKGGFLAYASGLLRAIILVPHVVIERSRIQRSRKIPPSQIDKLLYKSRPPKIPSTS
jgi:GT2 family glycosyltransferase